MSDQLARYPEYNQIIQAVLKADALLSGQKEVLELLAKRAPLFQVLHRLVSIVEEQYDGTFCSILLVDSVNKTFKAGVRVEYEKNYSEEETGVSILPPYMGPCCMASHLHEPVLVADIANDARWQAPWREWALSNDLQSCRSQPIYSSTGEVLGTFAMYHKKYADPTSANLYQIEVTSHIAGIAIERKLIEQAELLKIEDERRLNAELTQAIQMRDEFLSIASHELSSPLALLKMQTELHKEMLEEGELTHDDMVQLFDNHATRLDKVIAAVRTMLDSSSASAGKLELNYHNFDLNELLNDVVQRLKPLVEKSGTHIQLQANTPILGQWDQFKIEQVLTNLITNSIKYGDHKPIHISLSTEQGIALLEVQDQGIGIAPEDHGKIFERFERVVPTGNKASGLGLGLHIVKEIVVAHQGTIHVKSDIGAGSKFTVELPLQATLM